MSADEKLAIAMCQATESQSSADIDESCQDNLNAMKCRVDDVSSSNDIARLIVLSASLAIEEWPRKR